MKTPIVVLAALSLFACRGPAGGDGPDGPAGPTGTTATVQSHTLCSASPADVAGAQPVPGLVVTYEIYRYTDGAALVTAADVRKDGERTRTVLFSAKEAAAQVEVPIDLYSDVDTASGGKWSFTLFTGAGDRGAQVKYVDFGSAWNSSSWWMACTTTDVSGS